MMGTYLKFSFPYWPVGTAKAGIMPLLFTTEYVESDLVSDQL